MYSSWANSKDPFVLLGALEVIKEEFLSNTVNNN
jgi:hypothetical protein